MLPMRTVSLVTVGGSTAVGADCGLEARAVRGCPSRLTPLAIWFDGLVRHGRVDNRKDIKDAEGQRALYCHARSELSS